MMVSIEVQVSQLSIAMWMEFQTVSAWLCCDQ